MCFDLVCVAAHKHERPLPIFFPWAFWGERSAVYTICAIIRELQTNRSDGSSEDHLVQPLSHPTKAKPTSKLDPISKFGRVP